MLILDVCLRDHLSGIIIAGSLAAFNDLLSTVLAIPLRWK